MGRILCLHAVFTSTVNSSFILVWKGFSRLSNVSPGHQILLPRIYKYYFIWENVWLSYRYWDTEIILDIQVGPKCYRVCSYKREAAGSQTQRRQHTDRQKLEWCSQKPQHTGSHPKFEEARSVFFLWASEGSVALLTLTSVLQNYKRINFHCFKPPRLWHSVTGTTEN